MTKSQYLHIGVSHETVPTLVLGENCESPLRSPVRLITVKGLQENSLM